MTSFPMASILLEKGNGLCKRCACALSASFQLSIWQCSGNGRMALGRVRHTGSHQIFGFWKCVTVKAPEKFEPQPVKLGVFSQGLSLNDDIISYHRITAFLTVVSAFESEMSILLISAAC